MTINQAEISNNPSTKRRTLLAAGAAAGIGAMAGFPGRAMAAKFNLKASYITFASVVTYFAARERKFFEAQDIDIQDAAVANNIIVPTVLSGQYDMSVTNIVDVANVFLKGGDLRIIYPAGVIGPSHPYSKIVVPIDSPVRNAKDLAGKRIAVPSVQSSIDATFKFWLKKNGVDPAKVSVVSVGPAGLVPAIRSKQFDAAYVIEPTYSTMVQEGIAKSIGSADDAMADHIVAVYVARESWVEKNLDAARAYVRALDNANQYLMKNPEAVPGLITRYCGIKPEVAKVMIQAGLTRVASRKAMQEFFDVLAEDKVIEKRVDTCALLSRVCPKEGC